MKMTQALICAETVRYQMVALGHCLSSLTYQPGLASVICRSHQLLQAWTAFCFLFHAPSDKSGHKWPVIDIGGSVHQYTSNRTLRSKICVCSLRHIFMTSIAKRIGPSAFPLHFSEVVAFRGDFG